MKTWRNVLGLMFVMKLTLLGQGTILWDESVNGPFSNLANNPTGLGAFTVRTNSVFGSTTVTRTGNLLITSGDYFTFQVPIGTSVSGVYVSVDKSNVWSWLGNQQFTGELGFQLATSNGDLLPQWELTSLAPGWYGMYLLNGERTGDISVATYRLDFVVIPEPSTLWLLLGGLGWVFAVGPGAGEYLVCSTSSLPPWAVGVDCGS